jgi:hypothetical protein
MALRNVLILRKPRSGCLEGHTALLQPTSNPSHPLRVGGADFIKQPRVTVVEPMHDRGQHLHVIAQTNDLARQPL